MHTGIFFSYSWNIDDNETEVTCIRVYGLDEQNKNICLRIDNFTPYVYIELPENISWNIAKAQLVVNKINELLGNQKPLSCCLQMKKKLYGAYLDENGQRKKFPFLFCSFSNRGDIKSLTYKLKSNIHVVSMGSLKMKVHESDADPILQFVCCRKIPTAGWMKFYGDEVSEYDKLTLCDHEYKVKWKNVFPYESNVFPNPKIMGFDIEVNSTNPSAMPKAEKPGDKIFQISCVIARDGDTEDKYEKYLLTLGQPDQEVTGSDVLIYMYDTEAALLEGFTNFIREENPNIITGYNILGFDIPYMIARAKFNMCIYEFDKQGFHKYAHSKERIIKWSSSAYKNQEFEFLDAEGRVFVDLLPLVKRDFKFNNYKLKTISEYFLKGDTKDPLSVKGIFKCYRIGIKKNENGEYSKKAQRALGIVGKYCLKDSELVVRLMDKLKTWVGLTEMASVCNVSVFALYTQGQQIKVYSQLYKFCMYEGIVVEKDGYQLAENERYMGAKVFPPIPGRYSMVVPFDFCSLYPTTIIAYNIDYHTWVPDDSDIHDSMCHVMAWNECISCIHDPKVIRKLDLTKYIEKEKDKIKQLRDKRNKTNDKLRKKELMEEIDKQVEDLKPYIEERSEITKTINKNVTCTKRRYRFLKEPKGVLPTVIQNLLDARKHTRKVDMKKCEKEIERLKKDMKENGNDNTVLIQSQKTFLDVLDKRQLAYKVSCNSMYGAMGVKRGYLPFMPGAMCLDGNSQISFGYGFTRKMKDLVNTNYLWSYKDGQVISNGNGIIYNGKKEVVKITLIDGRTLRCTSDHKIMTTNGWIEAGNLLSKHNLDGSNFSTNTEYSKVVVGLELPEDIIGEDEKTWKLLDYTMDTQNNREKTLAFCRILGFILSDGSISSYLAHKNKKLTSFIAVIGTLLDAKMFVNDIKLLTGKEPKIGNCETQEVKGNTYNVHVPKLLVDKIIVLDGIVIGKHSHQPYIIPTFLFENNCPLSVIREFLGGLFGGDGTSPCLSKSHPSFSPIQFGLTTIEKYKDDMDNTMNKLINLLKKFDINFWCTNRLARVREHLLPKDIKENPRWEYLITTNCCYSLLFAQKIGFRYCSDKNNKLTVAASYQRYSDFVKKQHINLVLTASNMFDSTNRKINMKSILLKAKEEVYENDFYLNEWASLSKCNDIYNHRARPDSLKDFKLFPTAREYTKMTDCEHWFSKEQASEKVYYMDRTDTLCPCLHLDVVNVKYDGIDDVYDIIDVQNHSFVANGVVVHNCTTYMGRTNIEIVAKTIPEKYGGELIYGDTDSSYIHFPHLKNAQETWDYAIKVAKEISDMFPDPIELAFEEAIYSFFFILSKKRYMYRKCLRDGVVDNKIGKKGVLLARRDNSKFIRDTYEAVIGKIADYVPRDDIIHYIINQINEASSSMKPYTDFVVTKSVGNSGGLIPEAFVNEKGVKKAKVGDYIVPILSNNKEEREEQMTKKGANSEEEYYLLCLPAQVQLAERMRNRGQRVDAGSRLEYAICDPNNHNAKQYEKIESADYLVKHSEVVKIDYMYYLKALINPMDQVLDVAFGKDNDYKKGFIDSQYKFRLKIRMKLLNDLKDLFRPNLDFGK